MGNGVCKSRSISILYSLPGQEEIPDRVFILANSVCSTYIDKEKIALDGLVSEEETKEFVEAPYLSMNCPNLCGQYKNTPM